MIGLQQGAAEEKIRDAGFEPQVRDDPTSTEPAGTVTDQRPRRRHARRGRDGDHLRLGLRRAAADARRRPDAETPTDLPTDGLSPTRGAASATAAATVSGPGVGQVEQAGVRRRVELVLELEVPADRDVGVVGLLAVDLQVGVVGDGAAEPPGSPTASMT